MSATVAELSKRVGCSTATVSRVLNNSGFVSPQTREAVLQAVRETSYLNSKRRGTRRSAIPMEQRSPASNVIEIVQHRHSPVESILMGAHGVEAVSQNGSSSFRTPLSNSFHRQIVDGAVHELAAMGYRAQLAFNTDLLDPRFVAEVNSPNRAGVLLLGEPSADLERFAKQCIHPLVLVDIAGNPSVDVVTSDNLKGISLAFDHIYALGHRKIGYVGRDDSNFACAERFTAFKWKMAEVGLQVREDWIHSGFSNIEAAAVGMRSVLSSADRPTAVLCSNDCYALGTIRAASDARLSVPDQLSIIGFDDIESSAMVTPPLTTIHVPLQEMGRRGVRQLSIQLQARSGGPIRGCVIRLEPELVVRSSTAALKGV